RAPARKADQPNARQPRPILHLRQQETRELQPDVRGIERHMALRLTHMPYRAKNGYPRQSWGDCPRLGLGSASGTKASCRFSRFAPNPRPEQEAPATFPPACMAVSKASCLGSPVSSGLWDGFEGEPVEVEAVAVDVFEAEAGLAGGEFKDE